MVHLSGSFLGSTTALAPQNGAKTVMAATKIVRKAQKAANSATRTYKKFDGERQASILWDKDMVCTLQCYAKCEGSYF